MDTICPPFAWYLNRLGCAIALLAASMLLTERALTQDGSTITGITTTETPGTPITVTVSGANAPNQFAGQNLTLTYLGGTRVLSSYLTTQGTFAPIQVAGMITLRRNLSEATPTNNVVWNFITSHPSASSFDLAGPFIGQESAAFGGHNLNLLVGADNILGNRGDTNGNNNNIERIDSVFSGSGITVNDTLTFAVFERGCTHGHDGFKVAAITGLDANGNPSSYGPLIDILPGAWGTTSLGSLNTLVTRNNPAQIGVDATHPSAITSGQVLGGISLNVMQDLGILAGTNIFGYSLFGPDVSANANLVDWNSFPTNSNSNSPNGLDPLAYNGVLYHFVSGNPGPTTDWELPVSGDFLQATNWVGQATPNSAETAIINNGTTAILTGSSAVTNLETGIGYSGASGNAAVKGGNLSVTGTVAIGVDGAGTLVVTNAGAVTDNTTEIAQNPGSNGTVAVDGPGSNLTGTGNMTVGDAGNGTLIITNGGLVNDTNGLVGRLPASLGMVTIEGVGSRWNNSGTLDVGSDGAAVVDLTNGGAITAAGRTTIGPLGIVSGNGTIMTPILVSNGTLAPTGPNGTPGILTIRGSYLQGQNGELDIAVGGPNSSQADRLKVMGTATLNGTLALSSLNHFTPSSGSVYQILTAAGGVAGNFSHVLDALNTNGFTRTIVIAPNGVLLSYLRPLLAPSPPGVPSPGPPTVILTTPQSLPATLTNGQKNAILVPLLDPTADQLSSLYEIWFSSANTQRFNIESRFDDLADGSTGFVSNVSYPQPSHTGKEMLENKGVLDGQQNREPVSSSWEANLEHRWGVWVTGYGDFVNVEEDGLAKGYSFTTGGVTLGIDYRLTPHFAVGLMGGYGHTWTDLQPSGSIDLNTGWGGLYAGYFDHGFYLDGAVYGGHYTFDSARAGVFGIAKGSSTGGELSTYIAGGYDFHLGRLTIGPTAMLQYASASLDGFSEDGSIAPVRVSSGSQDSLRTDLGFRATDHIPLGSKVLRPFVSVVWEHEFNYSTLPLSVGLADIPNSPTRLVGPSLGQDSVVINSGVSVQWTPSLSTYVSYDGQLGRNHYNSNGVSGGFRWLF